MMTPKVERRYTDDPRVVWKYPYYPNYYLYLRDFCFYAGGFHSYWRRII